MAEKKIYAVRKGKTTGIFQSWKECQAAVTGYQGAEFKGFKTLEEAKQFLENGSLSENDREEDASCLTVYVDGSFLAGTGVYAFGCAFFHDNKIYTVYGNGNDAETAAYRNVAGEMLGAMYAVKTAIYNDYSSVLIKYDYEGIEKWVTGVWKTKKELTAQYAAYMHRMMQKIQIRFEKVPAHSNVYGNEIADQLAKTGLEKGQGIPGSLKLEEMEQWND